jgi:trimethylamine---corrinoid protein Co-methyltransferase
MAKFTFNNQPKLRLLTDEEILIINKKALEVLERAGAYFDSEEALQVLKKNGCDVDFTTKIVKFPPQLVMNCVSKVPETIQMYDREGNKSVLVGGDNVYFDPGSAGLNILESDGITARSAMTEDLIRTYRLTDALPNYPLQATALAISDVPSNICDCYRVYLMLKNTSKSMLAGAFNVEGITNIRDMLASVIGGYEELKNKPVAIFDVCSSPSLKWSHVSCQNIIDCARFCLPIETITVPMPGAASPATLAGSVLIAATETLSGIVLAQCVNPGNPMVFGGAPMTFDMRYSTTSSCAVEANIISTSYAQIARYYGMPVHTYACLSDPKIVDAQAGLESAMSGILAVMGGINIISGPGMLDFINTFSLEKLVIDHEIISMALRYYRGIEVNQETLATDLICRLGPGGDYISSEHTYKWFRQETYIPTNVIDRKNRERWKEGGETNIFDRAKKIVEEKLANHQPIPLGREREAKLDQVLIRIMKEMNIDSLPVNPVSM